MIDGFNGAYGFLSNFWKEPIEFEGGTYSTVEHAYQAAKTEDQNLRFTIHMAKTPGEAKRLGRGLKLRDDWEDVKIPIMKRLLHKKFRNPLLKAGLLQTGEQELIEGNYWHDNFWGICVCVKCTSSGETPQNWLGKLLMEVRSELQGTNSTPAGNAVEEASQR